ncbi:MAG: phosphodiester glycosidase family protein, partial [Bacilli bacterium]
MKRTIKFLSLFLLLFMFVVVIAPKQRAYATTSDNGNGNWTPTKDETINVMGMEHSSVWGVANGTNKQHINVLSMKTDGVTSKLVTWSHSDSKNYSRLTLDKIAEDYELNHPGWIVVGGTNGDQYTVGYGNDIAAGSAYFTPQTYYPLIMDNESRIPYTVQNSTNMHVGFANNGEANSLVEASAVKGFVLTIIDEYKNEIAKFNVDKINEAPGAGQTAVWSTYISIYNAGQYINQNVESSNDIYVVSNPELAYMNNCKAYGGVDSFFGRGTIDKVVNSVNLISNQFAIETSNEELKQALSVNTRIVVDAEYENDALNNCEASTGFHSVHRKDDVDQPLVHTSYDGNRYSRSIVGRKADGTYVLLTVDVANDPNDITTRYAGMGFDECNATLKHYGVVEAYQLDGGGSVTSIYRDENGKFVISNYVRDGVRANMTGLLFVVRDPRVDVEETTHHSVTLKLNDVLNGINSHIENVVASYNGQNYPLVDNEVIIDNLDENTEYKIDITYDIVSGEQRFTRSSSIKCKTNMFEGPTPEINVTNVGKSKITLSLTPNSSVKNVNVNINQTDYKFTDNKLEITDLIEDTIYKITISYDSYDEITGLSYKREIEKEVKTSTYDLPQISSFVILREYTNKVSIKYSFTDSDNVVTKKYILCNETEYEIKNIMGTLTIENLEPSTNIYILQLVLVCEPEGESTSYVKSEILSFGQTAVKHTITYDLDGGANSSSNPTEFTEGEEVVLSPATKEGYTFKGWELNGEIVTKISS